jgi:hypothetical protein
MGIGQFFKTPKNTVFEYKPRYYNPEKEDLEARIEKATQDVNGVPTDGTYKPLIKGQMRRPLDRRKANNRSSNIRLLLIAAALSALAYYYFYL